MLAIICRTESGGNGVVVGEAVRWILKLYNGTSKMMRSELKKKKKEEIKRQINVMYKLPKIAGEQKKVTQPFLLILYSGNSYLSTLNVFRLKFHLIHFFCPNICIDFNLTIKDSLIHRWPRFPCKYASIAFEATYCDELAASSQKNILLQFEYIKIETKKKSKIWTFLPFFLYCCAFQV